MKSLRAATPIVVRLPDELWIIEDGDGWMLSAPLARDRLTGRGTPAIFTARIKALPAGSTISIILPTPL